MSLKILSSLNIPVRPAADIYAISIAKHRGEVYAVTKEFTPARNILLRINIYRFGIAPVGDRPFIDGWAMPRILTPAGAAEFRNRLCEVGAQLFAEKGVDGFHMRELAHRMGVSSMTPYRYFKDKGAIMSEVRARSFKRFADWLETHLSTPDVDETTLGRAYLRYAIQEQDQYRLMFGFVQPADSILPTQVAQEQRVRNLLAAHLRVLASRKLIGGDPETLGDILWSVLHGAVTLHLANKLSKQEFDRTAIGALHLFMNATPEAEEVPADPRTTHRQTGYRRQAKSRPRHSRDLSPENLQIRSAGLSTAEPP